MGQNNKRLDRRALCYSTGVGENKMSNLFIDFKNSILNFPKLMHPHIDFIILLLRFILFQVICFSPALKECTFHIYYNFIKCYNWFWFLFVWEIKYPGKQINPQIKSLGIKILENSWFLKKLIPMGIKSLGIKSLGN